jgi:hypothetical protein
MNEPGAKNGALASRGRRSGAQPYSLANKSVAASAADTLWSLVSLGWLRVCGLTNFECQRCLANGNALAVTIAFVQPTRSVQERLASASRAMSSVLAGMKRTPAKASASATKSGWRKPAVGWGTRLQVICDKPQTSFDGPSTRRADARRSWLCVRQSPNIARLSQQRVRIAPHGGLTPAALVCIRSCVHCISRTFHRICVAQQERLA